MSSVLFFVCFCVCVCSVLANVYNKKLKKSLKGVRRKSTKVYLHIAAYADAVMLLRRSPYQ